MARKPSAGSDIHNMEDPAAVSDAPEKELPVQSGSRTSTARKAGAFLVVALISVALGYGISTAVNLPIHEQAESDIADLQVRVDEAESSHPEDAAQEACSHQWRTLGLFDSTDAVTHTEEHPEQTDVIDVLHTVCNTCYAIVDGETAAHTAATGHSGFTTDVPIPTTIVTQEAYSEEVTDEPATQRFTPVLEWCPICGAVQAAADPDSSASTEPAGISAGGNVQELPADAVYPDGYPDEG